MSPSRRPLLAAALVLACAALGAFARPAAVGVETNPRELDPFRFSKVQLFGVFSNWGQFADEGFRDRVLINIMLIGYVDPAVLPMPVKDLFFSEYRARAECRDLTSGLVLANDDLLFQIASSATEGFVGFGGTILALVPSTEGINFFGATVNSLPRWEVGDRYECTMRVVRPDKSVSGPANPPVMLRVVKSADEIRADTACSYEESFGCFGAAVTNYRGPDNARFSVPSNPNVTAGKSSYPNPENPEREYLWIRIQMTGFIEEEFFQPGPLLYNVMSECRNSRTGITLSVVSEYITKLFPNPWSYLASDIPIHSVVPSAEGLVIMDPLFGRPLHLNSLPAWEVGDRYMCTMRVVRPDGSVSGPSSPPVIFRVVKSAADILTDPACISDSGPTDLASGCGSIVEFEKRV